MNEFSLEQGQLGRRTESFDYSLASPPDWIERMPMLKSQG